MTRILVKSYLTALLVCVFFLHGNSAPNIVNNIFVQTIPSIQKPLELYTSNNVFFRTRQSLLFIDKNSFDSDPICDAFSDDEDEENDKVDHDKRKTVYKSVFQRLYKNNCKTNFNNNYLRCSKPNLFKTKLKVAPHIYFCVFRI